MTVGGVNLYPLTLLPLKSNEYTGRINKAGSTYAPGPFFLSLSKYLAQFDETAVQHIHLSHVIPTVILVDTERTGTVLEHDLYCPRGSRSSIPEPRPSGIGPASQAGHGAGWRGTEFQ